jgi:molybdenum-dependent DNA-binding transcriptional regulator ModE
MRSTLVQYQTHGNVEVSKLEFGFAVARRPALRFDLVDLRLFLNVAEAQSITHGAERSNLALASASGRIRGMEVALGTQLLARDRRGVKLTAAGQCLIEHARLVVQ